MEDPRAVVLATLAEVPTPDQAAAVHRASAEGWAAFWQASAIHLDDPEIEEVWWRNQYWLACAVAPGKLAPGLFGNWVYGPIGTAWHGDYHLNYNTQQVYWGVFSSNHLDLHCPYVDLVWHLLPMARDNARRMFGLPGAYFPHTAYPVPSPVNPYPAPPWAYQICETPWMAQSLWWEWQYGRDQIFLRDKAYPPIRESAVFLAAYAKREADGRLHLNPSVSPEKYGFSVDWRYNRDCIIDIALAHFVLRAAIEASEILGVDDDQRAS